MKLVRLVVSDLHLGSGARRGELNAMEDFFYDDRFAEFLEHYDQLAGKDMEIELILNGDIFDLLKITVDGIWPSEITDEIATEKLRQCLEGHPRFVRALRDFLRSENRRVTYLPGNHDLDMWFPGPQTLFRRYVCPEDPERAYFVTDSDTYYLPEGIQIRHGHQFERIHRADYDQMTIKTRDGKEILALPWGSLWILEVMNPLKLLRNHIDRIQPLGRFMWWSVVIDPGFVARFLWHSGISFIRHRVFRFQAWRDRIRQAPKLLREEIFELTGGYDERAARSLRKMRGAHTLIVGHSHGPRYRQLPDGKTLVNTGTWVKMINLDLHHLGQDSGFTYALIEYDDVGKPTTRLMRWIGKLSPFEAVPYTD